MANKVFIVTPSYGEDRVFSRFGWEVTHSLEDADLVTFTGGADISPNLYRQHRHPRAYTNERRDKEELTYFHAAHKLAKPMAGICRGGQLLNVLNGGFMWQDVDNHGGRPGHMVRDPRTGKTAYVNTVHHQMMIPHPDGEVFLVASESSRKEKMSPQSKPSQVVIHMAPFADDDVEGVWYAKTRCFCFQAHPEFAHGEGTDEVFFKYLEEFLGFKYHKQKKD